jgi:predicted MFS family arabinose efflux permease
MRPFAGGAAATLGILQAVRGAGTGAGPLFARSLLVRGYRGDGVAHAAALVAFAGTIGLAWLGGPVLALAAALAWGTGGGALWVITQTEIQERSTDDMRGRLLALDALGFTLGMSGGAFCAGFFVDRGFALAPVAAIIVAAAGLLWISVRARGAHVAEADDARDAAPVR